MDYYGGLLGMVAEIWFFTSKDVSYKTKIAAIIGFWIVTTAIIGVLALFLYATKSMVGVGLCAILELMFILCGILWWSVSIKVKNDIESGRK